LNEDNQIKIRGKGKRPPMLSTSLRLPLYVIEYFDTHHTYTKQATIREILINYVKQQEQQNDKTNS
jgi:hypothetical protein